MTLLDVLAPLEAYYKEYGDIPVMTLNTYTNSTSALKDATDVYYNDDGFIVIE